MSGEGFVYGKGFHGEERDGLRRFRWMSDAAELAIPAGSIARARYLTIPIFTEVRDFGQVLTIRRGGRVLAEFALVDQWNDYDIPLAPEGGAEAGDPAGSAVILTLSLNKLFPPEHYPGDTRRLGARIGPPELRDETWVPRILPIFQYGKGFYDEERQGLSSFHWMSASAELLARAGAVARARYLSLPVFTEIPDLGQVLTVRRGDRILAEFALLDQWNEYDIPLVPEGGKDDGIAAGDIVTLTLSLNKQVPRECYPDDPRPLGVRIGPPELHSDEGLHRALMVSPQKSGAFAFGPGFHKEEVDEFSRFRWMSDAAELTIAADEASRNRFLTIPLLSEFKNFSQVLTVRRGGRLLAEFALLDQWNYYDVPLAPEDGPEDGAPADAAVTLTLSLNKPVPRKYFPDDPRRLGVRVGPLELHDDAELHRNLLDFHRNAVLNYREMTSGRAELASYPLNLGIDIHGKCNISPHCVYCLWDSMKVLEGANVDVPVDARTLKGYGPFFTSARTLVNCSFGEPLLHPKFTELMEFCARNKKIVELATNGQAFTERTIRALVGRSVYLYISLDAASKATYAKIRNDRWDEIIPGLRRLGEERRKAGNLPRIFMVFIPMRVNRDDLEEYFKLCVIVGADALVLRPMLFLTEPNIVEERGGHVFDYEKEMLNRREVEEVIRKAGEFSKLYGVPVASQFDFGLMKEPRVGRKEDAS